MSRTSKTALPEIPHRLIEDIVQGHCVAFVGAGFSAVAVPGWQGLLKTLADGVPAKKSRTEIQMLVERAKTPLEFEMVGQLLRDALGDGFDRAVSNILTGKPTAKERRRMLRRQQLLAEIPFAGVLTTNLDRFIEGRAPQPEVYRDLLRPQRRWWSRSAWKSAPNPEYVIKLHGDVDDLAKNSPVLARADYRRRVYGAANYATFLRAILASRTVLYLGVSFTDAYMNELRSEVLAMLDPKPHHARRPMAYAIMNDVGATQRKYFRKHEGMEVLSYPSYGDDYSGFDDLLEQIHGRTSTVARLGDALADKRLLWVDAHPSNNSLGYEVLMSAVKGQKGACTVLQVKTPAEAAEQLKTADWDLVISHYGVRYPQPPVIVELLSGIRQQDHRVPVIVFSLEDVSGKRRREVLGLGAFDYIHLWEDLFRLLVAVLA